MTKANVLQLGLLLFFLGGIIYGGLQKLGLDQAKAGIASEGLLLLLLLTWVSTYFFRVVSGKMTFMEQRKRYLKEYKQITNRELEEKFDSLSLEEKASLIQQLQDDNNNNK